MNYGSSSTHLTTACLRDALRLRDHPRDSSNPAPPLRPCVRLCTYALSAPQQAAHTAWRAISALPPVANPLSPSPPRPSPQHGCPMSPAFTHRIQTIQPALLTAQMNDMPLDLSQSFQARRGRTRTHYMIPCTPEPHAPPLSPPLEPPPPPPLPPPPPPSRRPRRGPLLRKVGDHETTVKTQETSIRMLQDRLTRMGQSVVELTQSNAKRALPPMHRPHEHL